jgi:hypothetical protein
MLSQITRGQAVADIIGGLYLGSAALVAAAMVIACVVVAQYRSIAPGRTTAMDHVSGIMGIGVVLGALTAAFRLYTLVPEVRLWEHL